MQAMLTTIWRRHVAACPHKAKGRNHLKCSCPLWGDGYQNGKRVFRQSLGTRDVARARKLAMSLEADDAAPRKPIPAAVSAFLDHAKSLKPSSFRKYRNILNKLEAFCSARHLDTVDELTTEVLDSFRAHRELSPLTASKELQVLRQFCGFCADRQWAETNAAKKIKGPRNLPGNDVVPFTPAEVQKILSACDAVGRTAYERSRARAMILLLRYTALRIGDVALLSRDRVSKEGNRWRIFLRTEKSGKPVFLPLSLEVKNALDCVPSPRGYPHSPYFFWSGVSKEKSVKADVDRSLRAVFVKSGVPNAHAHRFRHTLATELLGSGASFEEVADILGNTPDVVRKHYGKWSVARQQRIDDLMQRVHGVEYRAPEVIQ